MTDCPVSSEHATIPRENTGDADMWCIDCHAFRNAWSRKRRSYRPGPVKDHETQLRHDIRENITMIRKLLNWVRDNPRTLNQGEMDIYMDVIAHGECMPTREELDYTNPSKTREEIDAAVTGLIDGGIIRPVGTVDDGEYVTIYALTEYGAEKASEACTDVQAMRDDYQRLGRTEAIRKLEAIERPATKEVGGVYVPKSRAD